MKPSLKSKIANSIGNNQSFNKKILGIKSSWDQVDSILQKASLPKKHPKGR